MPPAGLPRRPSEARIPVPAPGRSGRGCLPHRFSFLPRPAPACLLPSLAAARRPPRSPRRIPSPGPAHYQLAAECAVHRAAIIPVDAAGQRPAAFLHADAEFELAGRAIRFHAARQRRVAVDDEAAAAIRLVYGAQAAVGREPNTVAGKETVLEPQADAQALGITAVQPGLGQCAGHRIHVVYADAGVLDLRHQGHGADLPAGVARLQVECPGIAAGLVAGGRRTQAGLEVHPAPRRVEIEIAAQPGGIEACAVQVGLIAAGTPGQSTPAVGLAQQHAVMEAVADREVHADLDTIGLLREPEILAGCETAAGGADITIAVAPAHPGSEPVHHLHRRQNAHVH